ncbi:helix-turn-helix domain-containing protein [Roseococcus pinisoli]|uniref:Helix-turn-helix domain-containing protein n=1 Tax=Roseococcus pinisoli TaxID=2835040 RepID=A0ABS5QA18_9PROT|nr:AraC family transcriptional regulator [Roseococcus pinisoli]MBS7809767.1 helix-turn-helix domain-containing protein [Roseococcus pinisoli]
MVFALNRAEGAAVAAAGPDYATDWHAHDCAMLLLPRQGAMRFELEGRRPTSPLRPGQALLVAPGLAHRTRASGEAHRHLVLYLPLARLGRWPLARRAWHLGLVPPAMTPLLAYRDGLPDASERARLADRLLLEEAAEVGPEPTAEQHGAAVVQALVEHLRARLNEPHSLEELAARFGLSRRQMTRLFRRHVGTSIADHLNGLRVREAARRIGAGQGVLAAAHAVGLASPSHLARLFRRHAGTPPSAARSGAE